MATPIEPTGSEEVQGETSEEVNNAPGLNPAWEPVLGVLPEQFHEVVTPHFQKWDQEAQNRIESVNSQLKQFEAYKPFVEHGITPDEVEQGLRLMYEINNNPQSVYQALADAYKFGQQETPPVAKTDDNAEEESILAQLPPDVLEKLNQHDNLLQAVSQIVLNDANAKQAAQADKELADELDALKEKIGDYDERYVLTMMQSGMSAEEAGQAFVNLKQSLTPQPFAPNTLGAASGSGGVGIPSNAIDPTSLSGKDTRDLVVQMLAAANNKK